MHHIIYKSYASKPMTLLELMPILMQARVLNERHDITGALVYGGNQFMQLIEGEQTVITTLYQRICQDPRHERVVKLVDDAIEARSFTQWSMAFDEVSADQLKDLLGMLAPRQLAYQVLTSSAAEKLLVAKMREIVCA